jgi:hypothetical protein
MSGSPLKAHCCSDHLCPEQSRVTFNSGFCRRSDGLKSADGSVVLSGLLLLSGLRRCIASQVLLVHHECCKTHSGRAGLRQSSHLGFQMALTTLSPLMHGQVISWVLSCPGRNKMCRIIGRPGVGKVIELALRPDSAGQTVQARQCRPLGYLEE